MLLFYIIITTISTCISITNATYIAITTIAYITITYITILYIIDINLNLIQYNY